MRVFNKRKFATAVIATAVSVACLLAYFAVSQESRFIAAFFLALVFAGIEYRGALSKDAVFDELKYCADERDAFITMKAGRMAVLIFNRLLLVGCIASTLLYAVFRWPSCLAVVITLCIVSVALFVVILLTNLYYEKRA